MNPKFLILILAMVVMDIIDGDFKALSILDILKIVLYILCFVLLLQDAKKEKIGENE